jgi:hypothetical protein
MKAFRSIRRGVIDIISNIKKGTFGNDFKGSPLEFVLTCITEQKQVFEGAAHPFYWKPKFPFNIVILVLASTLPSPDTISLLLLLELKELCLCNNLLPIL